MKIDFEKILSQYKYCFLCKGSLIPNDFNSLKCASCGHMIYINPITASGAILENEKREILLVERGVDPKKGFFDSPGGFVDIGESAEVGMLRELKEELGVTVTNLTYFSSEPDFYPFGGIENVALGLIFTGSIGNQKITVHDDVSGYKFFKPSEIPFEKIAFEGFRKILKKYINDRR